MHDKVIQKFQLLRILLSGQRDEDEEANKKFVVDSIHKIIHEALGNHNEVFLNMFRNVLKEVMCSAPVDQTGPAYFNASQSANGIMAGTSKQPMEGEIQQAPNVDNTQQGHQPIVQSTQQLQLAKPTHQLQSSQMATFDTSAHIPLSAKKIASSVHQIAKDVDQAFFNAQRSPTQGIQSDYVPRLPYYFQRR